MRCSRATVPRSSASTASGETAASSPERCSPASLPSALGSGASIAIVAGLTCLSGLLVSATPWQELRTPDRLRFRRWLPSPTSSRPMRAGFLRSGKNAHPSWEGAAMRAIECPCSHHLDGADDEELFQLAREHVDRDHPEMQRTDAQLRERIAADAYD